MLAEAELSVSASIITLCSGGDLYEFEKFTESDQRKKRQEH